MISPHRERCVDVHTRTPTEEAIVKKMRESGTPERETRAGTRTAHRRSRARGTGFGVVCSLRKWKQPREALRGGIGEGDTGVVVGRSSTGRVIEDHWSAAAVLGYWRRSRADRVGSGRRAAMKPGPGIRRA